MEDRKEQGWGLSIPIQTFVNRPSLQGPEDQPTL